MMWEQAVAILQMLRYPAIVVVSVSVVVAVILWARGIIPVLFRLGNGLSRRKIAVFAKGDALVSLENILRDCNLFRQNNIVRIATDGDIGAANSATVFLVYWPDWKANIEDVLREKSDGTALIVYAPQEYGFIPKETMSLLDKQRNVVVNNFRGRLLNDIVVSMITTSYKNK